MVNIPQMENDSLDQGEPADHGDVAYKLATRLTKVQQDLSTVCEGEVGLSDYSKTNKDRAEEILNDLGIEFIDVSGCGSVCLFGFFGIKVPLNVGEEEGILQSVNNKRSKWKPELIAQNLEEDFGFQSPQEPFMALNEMFRKIKLIGKYKGEKEANDLLNKQVEKLTEWLAIRANGSSNIVPIVNPRYNWYNSSHPSKTEIQFVLFSPYIVPVKSSFAQYFIDYRKRNPRELSPRGKAERFLSQLE